jgi:hypothetical protein
MADSLSPLYRGDTRTIRVTITDDAGAPIDISGHSLWLTLKTSITDPDASAILQVSALMPAGGDSASGIGYLTLSSADTDGLTPGKYPYDIQWVQPGSPPIVKTVDAGKLKVMPDVTISV